MAGPQAVSSLSKNLLRWCRVAKPLAQRANSLNKESVWLDKPEIKGIVSLQEGKRISITEAHSFWKYKSFGNPQNHLCSSDRHSEWLLACSARFPDASYLVNVYRMSLGGWHCQLRSSNNLVLLFLPVKMWLLLGFHISLIFRWFLMSEKR